MLQNEFPILEYDEEKNAFIKPSFKHQKLDISEKCVLCFFSEAIEMILNETPHKIVSSFKSEGMNYPL